MVRIRMHATGNEDGMGGRLTGGLYTLSIKAELFLDGKEIVDTRSGVAVLRIIPGLETNGTIDLSYGATGPETIRIDIDDTAAIELKDFETFEGGAAEFQGTPNRDGDWTVTFPTYDVEDSTGTWYINGEEIDAGMFEKSVRGDHTKFTVPEAFLETQADARRKNKERRNSMIYYDEDEEIEYDKRDDRIPSDCPECGCPDAEYGDGGYSCPNEDCPNYDPYFYDDEKDND